ncbi:MAG: sarcosine oxidase subunit delta [Micrococcus sp.]|nr:sarcosine oxidase subunit delta [Micrococcus sp.]
MIQIPCPWCGPRNVTEFHHYGPSATRPSVADTTVEGWHRYLYFRANPLGPVEESWYHAAGCRRFVAVVRDTHSNQITPAEGAER